MAWSSPFFRAPALCWWSPHDGGVDHHVLVVVIACQGLKDTTENPAFTPRVKPSPHALPVCQTAREVAPGNAGSAAIEHRFDEETMSFVVPPTRPSRPGRNP